MLWVYVDLVSCSITVALKLWRPFLHGQRVMLQCDSESNVFATASGSSCVKGNSGLREIRFLTAFNDINVPAKRIPGLHNAIAEHVSRWYLSIFNIANIPRTPSLFTFRARVSCSTFRSPSIFFLSFLWGLPEIRVWQHHTLSFSASLHGCKHKPTAQGRCATYASGGIYDTFFLVPLPALPSTISMLSVPTSVIKNVQVELFNILWKKKKKKRQNKEIGYVSTHCGRRS